MTATISESDCLELGPKWSISSISSARSENPGITSKPNTELTSTMASNATESSSKLPYNVRFNYQSKDISFPDWVSLLTICFAPLLAHLIAGAPKTVYAGVGRPPWHEKFAHYNPMSIIWRYFAIADRCCRATDWKEVDMIAGNTLYWADDKWDGSENIVMMCRSPQVRSPPPFMERLYSKETLKTLVVTLQGVQSVYLILRHGTPSFGGFALDTIFMPVALIGLLRLPAALWLTDEHLQLNQDENAQTEMQHSTSDNDVGDAKETSHVSTQPLFETPSMTTSNNATNSPSFRKALGFWGITVRAFYLVFLLGSLAMCLYIMIPKPHRQHAQSLSSTLLGYFYGIFLLVGIFLLIHYSRRNDRSATHIIIPCISTVWYKLYTVFLTLLMVVLIIVAALETRRTPCGSYVTATESRDDITCPNLCKSNVTAKFWMDSGSKARVLHDRRGFLAVAQGRRQSPELSSMTDGVAMCQYDGSWILLASQIMKELRGESSCAFFGLIVHPLLGPRDAQVMDMLFWPELRFFPGCWFWKYSTCVQSLGSLKLWRIVTKITRSAFKEAVLKKLVLIRDLKSVQGSSKSPTVVMYPLWRCSTKATSSIEVCIVFILQILRLRFWAAVSSHKGRTLEGLPGSV